MEDRIGKLRWEQYNTEQDMLREQQLLDKAKAKLKTRICIIMGFS